MGHREQRAQRTQCPNYGQRGVICIGDQGATSAQQGNERKRACTGKEFVRLVRFVMAKRILPL